MIITSISAAGCDQDQKNIATLVAFEICLGFEWIEKYNPPYMQYVYMKWVEYVIVMLKIPFVSQVYQ